MKKRICSLLLVLAILMSTPTCAWAASDGALETAADGAARYLMSAVPEPQYGSQGGEWAVLGLARSGFQVPQSYYDRYYAGLEQYVQGQNGLLHARKYTEYSRVILAVTALGRDARSVGGYDLTVPLGDYDKTVYQGLNGAVWALLALDSGDYPMPAGSAGTATRQRYVDCILSAQLADGGWTVGASGGGDPDVTAMALQALAGYEGQEDVAEAIGRGMQWLEKNQAQDGGLATYGTANAESIAQVVIALCTLGVSMDDPRFVKSGNTLTDALLRYQTADGGFRHTLDGAVNQMATEQAFLALTAVLRAQTGEESLYRMDPVPAKHPSVKTAPVTLPGQTFADVAAHPNRAAIDALAERGVINGKGNGHFDPDASMTRAEFAAITVRALGLTPLENDAFADVPAGKWYASYVGTANTYGIVNGVGNNRFHPGGTITRQEAAVMVARAARLAGLDTALSDAEADEILAEYPAGGSVAGWAKGSLAFCLKSGVLTGAGIEPAAPIRRCEIAQMLYNLLLAAELL